METRSKAMAKKLIPVTDKKVEEPKVEKYKDYDALQKKCIKKFLSNKAKIDELVRSNIKELKNYESLHYKNINNFNNRCNGTRCHPERIVYVICDYDMSFPYMVGQCEYCNRFLLHDYLEKFM